MSITTESEALQELVEANHILFKEGVVDAFGHVSARHPERPDHFLLARNLAPGSVASEDLIEFDLEGEPARGDVRRPYLERFIHSEIYRTRPDVRAIVHSHSSTVVSFSLVRTFRFRPVCHMCGFLGEGAEHFDIRDLEGPATDLLIRNRRLGQALAQSLGSSNVVLMRGHGSTVVAPSLKQAVYRAVYTEVNARILADALRIGSVEYLSPEEASAAALTIEAQIERPWQLWKAAAQSARSGNMKA
jgi:ribulose-5-phosphate 4-epimerase/fuculose-1-phosphate aldolase